MSSAVKTTSSLFLRYFYRVGLGSPASWAISVMVVFSKTKRSNHSRADLQTRLLASVSFLGLLPDQSDLLNLETFSDEIDQMTVQISLFC
jgi:hypothetical protein